MSKFQKAQLFEKNILQIKVEMYLFKKEVFTTVSPIHRMKGESEIGYKCVKKVYYKYS